MQGEGCDSPEGFARLTILCVDNGRESANCERVVQTVPCVGVLRMETNAGVAGGFNAGLR